MTQTATQQLYHDDRLDADYQSLKRGRPRKPDKRSRTRPACIGFTPEILQETSYRTPAIWLLVCAEIDSLAELKVVQYVMAHTCQNHEEPVELTNDEFMNGRKYSDDPEDEERMDFGTGLSESGVRSGLERAIAHGFLTCTTDKSNKARIRNFYQLHMQEGVQTLDPAEEIEVHNLYPDEDTNDIQEHFVASEVRNLGPQRFEVQIVDPIDKEREEVIKPPLEPIEPEVQIVDLLSSDSKYIYNHNNKDIFRITRKSYPTYLNKTIETYSRDLGDHEHIASNIGQCRRLYDMAGYSPEAFKELLCEVKDLAQKASVKKVNSRGWPNRMPYFFKCLRRIIASELTKEEIQV